MGLCYESSADIIYDMDNKKYDIQQISNVNLSNYFWIECTTLLVRAE